MIATILSLLANLAGLLSKALSWMHERDLIKQGEANAHLDSLTRKVDATRSAIAAREAVRRQSAAGELPDDDPFCRD